jgi:hypothetical protein
MLHPRIIAAARRIMEAIETQVEDFMLEKKAKLG